MTQRILRSQRRLRVAILQVLAGRPGRVQHVPSTSSVGLRYRLTSDLVLPDADATDIEMQWPDVAIDTSGFEIVTGYRLGATISWRPSPGAGPQT